MQKYVDMSIVVEILTIISKVYSDGCQVIHTDVVMDFLLH